MYLCHCAAFVVYAITYVWHGGDNIHVEFASEAFLYNFHVEQAEEAAAKAESESCRRLGGEGERCVVELKFFERRAQVFEFFGFDGVYAGEYHRFNFLEAFDRIFAGVVYAVSYTHLTLPTTP